MSNKSLIHFIANCMDCSWETGDFLAGQKAARQHAKRYKHKVSGESGYSVVYDGRDEARAAEAEKGNI